MASSTDFDETTAKWQTSKEEHIATWHFVMLDNNKNKVYENIQQKLCHLSPQLIFMWKRRSIFLKHLDILEIFFQTCMLSGY